MVERKEDTFFSSKVAAFIELVKELRRIVMLFLVIVLFMVFGWLDVSVISWIDWLWQGDNRFFLLGFIISTVLLYIPTKKIVKYFYDPDTELIVVVNATEDRKIACYELGTELMDKMTVDGDKLHSWRGAGGIRTHMVREYDPVENKAVATYHGEISDDELMEVRSKIEDYRFRKNKWVKYGQLMKARFPSIVEEIEAAFWNNKTDAVLDLMDFDHEELFSEVEAEIEQKREEQKEEKQKNAELDLNINVSDALSESEAESNENTE